MRYLLTFEKADGRKLPLTMEADSVDGALWDIMQSRPYMDFRDYDRYTWTTLPSYDEDARPGSFIDEDDYR